MAAGIALVLCRESSMVRMTHVKMCRPKTRGPIKRAYSSNLGANPTTINTPIHQPVTSSNGIIDAGATNQSTV